MGEKSKKKNKPQKRPLTYAAKGVDVTIGHQHCVPGGRFPRVPREMGWLWTSRDVPGLQFRPDWRPGAVRRSVARIIKRYTRNVIDSGPDLATKLKKKLASKTALGKAAHGKNAFNHDDHDDKATPTFVIKNVDGDYIVTLQELKDIKTRKVTDYPYADGPPYTFKVLNKSADEMKRIERKRERARKYAESLLFQEAFDNICREIYDNMDREELCNFASKKNTCVCQAIQEEILNNFSSSVGDVSGLCPLTGKESSCGEEEWSIEFTPPIARFDPNRKMRSKMNRATQFEPKGTTDEDDEANKWKHSMLDGKGGRGDLDGQDGLDGQEGGSGLDDGSKKKKGTKKGSKKSSAMKSKETTGAMTFISDKDKFEECTPVADPCCVCPVCYDDPCCYGYYYCV